MSKRDYKDATSKGGLWMSQEEEICVQANGELFLLEHQPRLPRGADLYKKPAVESDPARGFPGKDK